MHTRDVTPLQSQIVSYKNLSVGVKRRCNGLYQCPVIEVIDTDVWNLRKEGTDKDREVGGALCLGC